MILEGKVSSGSHRYKRNVTGDNLSSKRVKYSSENYSLLQLFVEEAWEKNKIKNLGKWLSSQKIDINSRSWYKLWKNDGCLAETSMQSNNVDNEDSFEKRITSELRNILPFLFKCNDDINYTDDFGQTILHVYLANFESSYDKLDLNKKCKVFRIVISLLDKGASIYATDKKGKTPLHVAAEKKKVELIEQMLKFSKYIDTCDMEGNTVLHKIIYCFNAGDEDAFVRGVRMLLSKGANPNKRNEKGMTPLQYAVSYCNVDLLNIFKEYDGDFNVLTVKGDNLLHLAYKDSLLDDRRMMETINFLVKQGCNANSNKKNESSIIHMAVERSAIKTVDRLIELGADVNCQTKIDRRTPLHLAVLTFPRSLLEYQADENQIKTCISMLSYAGADWDAIDWQGLNPFHHALMQPNNPKLLAYVLNFGGDINDHIARNIIKGLDKDSRLDFYSHAVELKAIGFSIHKDYEMQMKKRKKLFRSYRQNCLREVNAMKNYMISDGVSIYQFLHMNWKRQLTLVNLVPQDLQQKFPIYNYSIRNACFKVKRRKQLLKPAKMAWYLVTKINLPDICVERIFDFSNNWSLKVLIDMSDKCI